MGLVYVVTVVETLLLDALFFRFRLAQLFVKILTGLGMQGWLVLSTSLV